MSEEREDLEQLEEGAGSESQTDQKLDLSQIPEFRAWQARTDKRVAEVQREAEEAKRRAAAAEREREAVIQAMTDDNPQAVERILEQAELAELRAFKRQQEQELASQRAWQEFTNYHIQLASAVGIDTSNPTFRRALETGDPVEVEKAKAQILSQRPPSPREQQRQELQEKARSGDLSTIPAGAQGRPQSDLEMRRAEYRRLKMKLPQGDVDALWALKKQYRDVAD